MPSRKYTAAGVEVEFEPGSRGRVLRNLLSITRVRDMNEAESQALELAQEVRQPMPLIAHVDQLMKSIDQEKMKALLK